MIESIFHGSFWNNFKAESIQDSLRTLAKDPHTGGTEEDEVILVDFIEGIMKNAQMTVQIPEYDVLLSYPQREDGKRNYVYLSQNDTELWRSAEIEEILAESQNNSLVFNPFMWVNRKGKQIIKYNYWDLKSG